MVFCIMFTYFSHILLLKSWNPQDGFKHSPAQVKADIPLEVPFRSLSSGVTNGVSFMLNLEVRYTY